MWHVATGCPDYKTADSGSVWVRYSDDRQTAEVGCGNGGADRAGSTNKKKTSWQLQCRDGEWTGYVDHCAQPGATQTRLRSASHCASADIVALSASGRRTQGRIKHLVGPTHFTMPGPQSK